MAIGWQSLKYGIKSDSMVVLEAIDDRLFAAVNAKGNTIVVPARPVRKSEIDLRHGRGSTLMPRSRSIRLQDHFNAW